jgi:lipopolysaccharide transport system permease protein
MRYIESGTRWHKDDIAELWHSRELLSVLVARDVKVRYRQAVIGVAWVILQPVATLAVFQVFFGLLGARPASGNSPYIVSAYVGLLIWQLFASAVRDGTHSLAQNRQILTRVYFPRLFLPSTSVGCAVFDFLVAAPLLIALLIWYGTIPGPGVAAAPLFVLLAVTAALAAAIWLSALNALYRDIGHIVPFALQIGFFLSPVVYETAALIPQRWRVLYELNPLTASIDGLRWSLLGTRAPTSSTLAVSVLLTLAMLLSGLLYFRRAEQWLADRL